MNIGDVQKAVIDDLSNDATLSALLGGPNIYDFVPRQTNMPYVAMGPVQTDDWSTSDGEGQAMIFTLHCWSRHEGRKQLYQIADRIKQLLLATFKTPEGSPSHIVLCHRLSERFENDVAAGSSRAILRFRMLVEASQ